jgi:hypothetical protein
MATIAAKQELRHAGLGLFEKWLSIWVRLAIAAGGLARRPQACGRKEAPDIPLAISRSEIGRNPPPIVEDRPLPHDTA